MKIKAWNSRKFLSIHTRSSLIFQHEQISTKSHKPYINGKVFPSTSWISHPLILTLPNLTGSIQNMFMHQNSNHHNSLISQRKLMIQLAEFSTKQDLSKSSINFMNHWIRKLTLIWWQLWIRVYQAWKRQNRNSMMLGWLNEARFVCWLCTICSEIQFAIVGASCYSSWFARMWMNPCLQKLLQCLEVMNQWRSWLGSWRICRKMKMKSWENFGDFQI